MSANENTNNSNELSPTAQRNIESLLRTAYDPQPPERQFADSTRAKMLRAAALRRPAGVQPKSPIRVARHVWRYAGLVAAAAAIIVLAVLIGRTNDERVMVVERGAQRAAPPAMAAAMVGDRGLTARPAATAPAVETIAMGTTIQTREGARKLVTLPDGSRLYVNSKTRVKVAAERRLEVQSGQVYVEVAHRDGERFVVATPQREVTALGTKFAVAAADNGTRVTVTQGKVRVSGYGAVLPAGRQLDCGRGREQESAAPPASYALGWTQELVEASQTPLVPASDYEGGALVAIDPQGQEARLSLRRYHVDVHIEDGFARTTIDQTYFNHMHSRLEGTFYFPLPPDASISRLAMYVDGKLMEGGMAERDHARQVFESIMYTRRDPALLEWVDGTTFKMRVFPLEGRQEKRIILSYAQRLESLESKATYRFPGGHNMPSVGRWSFHARVVGGYNAMWACNSHPLVPTREGDDLLLDTQAENVAVPGLAVELTGLGDAAAAAAGRFSTALHDGQRYLMLRYRPTLPAQVQAAGREPRDWLFLVESSGDRDPLLARAQIEIVRTLLYNAQEGDRFAILSAGTHTRAFATALQPVEPQAVAAGIKFLENAHLVGALDLEGSLAAAREQIEHARNGYLVHVGSGIAVLGEPETSKLAALIPQGTHYVGVGVGKRWGRNFMKEAAARTGGYCTQINPDENIGWRAFELASTLQTPRLLDIKVTDPAGHSYLLFADSISQGEELCAATRFDGKGQKLPATVTVSGTIDGRPFQQELKLDKAADKADYLPRFWAKLEIDRMIAAGAEANRQAMTDLSKAMYVMCPYTSLLVLENDAMYEQYKVDRGRKDHWALYDAPKSVPVVTEPDPRWTAPPATDPANAAKPTAEQVLQTIYVRLPRQLVRWPNDSYYGGGCYTAWQMLYQNRFGGYGPVWVFDRSGSLNVSTTASGGWDWAWFDGAAERTMIVSGIAVPSDVPLHVATQKDSLLTRLSMPGEPLTAPRLRLFNGQMSYVSYGAFDNERIGFGLETGEPLTRIGLYKALDSRGGSGRYDTRLSEWAGDRVKAELDFTDYAARWRPGVDGRLGWDADFQWRTGDAKKGKFSRETLDLGLAIGRRIRNHKELVADAWSEWRGQPFGQRSVLYQRPQYTGDTQVFSDLLSFAGGFATTWADVQAVVEAEAQSQEQATVNRQQATGEKQQDHPVPPVAGCLVPGASLPAGQIDDAARAIIDRARRVGWQTATVMDKDAQKAVQTITFDGAGRLSIKRVNEYGLGETILCDGSNLYHLYGELGVGTRRPVSRFHRAELSGLLPWVVPQAEDLARGCDIRADGPDAVVLTPVGAAAAKDEKGKPRPYVQVRLAFDAAGRLVERRVVAVDLAVPDSPRKVLSVTAFAADGTITIKDGDGKTVDTIQCAVRKADAPDLAAPSDLVILPMPFRTLDHVYRQYDKPGVERFTQWTDEGVMAALAAGVCNDGNAVLNIIGQRFLSRGDRRIGIYTLLLTALRSWNPAEKTAAGPAAWRLDPVEDFPTSPLARYIRQQAEGNRTSQTQFVWDGNAGSGFVDALAGLRYLSYEYSSGRANSGDQRLLFQQRVLYYTALTCSPAMSRAVLTLATNYGYGDSLDINMKQLLKGTAEKLQKAGDQSFYSRYEVARLQYRAGQTLESQDSFEKLYTDCLSAGLLPPFDGDFYNVMSQPTPGQTSTQPEISRFDRLMRNASAELIGQGRRSAAVMLAWQCQEVGNAPLATDLLSAALTGAKPDEQAGVTLTAIEMLYRFGQYTRADVLLEGLLAEKPLANDPGLWRLGAMVANSRGRLAESLARTERAMDLEYANLPAAINLQAVRQDYGDLLSRYVQLAQAIATLQSEAPRDMVARVVRTADRWRSLDPDGLAACQGAAGALGALGEQELAWEYLTTPLAAKPNEAAPWVALAAALRNDGRLDLADRAYAAAFRAEGTNAQILWDRAQLLQQMGKTQEARALYRQIAEGEWPRQFSDLPARARQYLGS